MVNIMKKTLTLLFLALLPVLAFAIQEMTISADASIWDTLEEEPALDACAPTINKIVSGSTEYANFPKAIYLNPEQQLKAEFTPSTASGCESKFTLDAWAVASGENITDLLKQKEVNGGKQFIFKNDADNVFTASPITIAELGNNFYWKKEETTRSDKEKFSAFVSNNSGKKFYLLVEAKKGDSWVDSAPIEIIFTPPTQPVTGECTTILDCLARIDKWIVETLFKKKA